MSVKSDGRVARLRHWIDGMAQLRQRQFDVDASIGGQRRRGQLLSLDVIRHRCRIYT
jgi:hypothetical protein